MAGMLFRTRDPVVRQRTQLINAIRGHLTEYGWVAPKGPSHVAMLADILEDQEMTATVPATARDMLHLVLSLRDELNNKLAELDREIAMRA